MRYYIWHNGNKVYFEFSLEGFKQAQAYVENYGLGKRKLYVEGQVIGMWYVFNREDSWQCGVQVSSEVEAIRRCKEDSSLTYMYVNVVGFGGDLDPYCYQEGGGDYVR